MHRKRSSLSLATHMMGHRTAKLEGDTRGTRHWSLNLIIFLCGIFLILTYGASMTYVIQE